MIYYIDMSFSFGHYLHLLMPFKRMGFSREDFLYEIYKPVIEKYKVTDKNGQPYIISRELASNLFNRKSNLPVVLQTAMKKAIKDGCMLSQGLSNVFDDLYSPEILQEITNNVLDQIEENHALPKSFFESIRQERDLGELISVHWFLFVYFGSKENRGTNAPKRKQGRPKDDLLLLNFFYLSEEEKYSLFSKMNAKFSKEGAIVSCDELHYYVNSLAFCSWPVPFNLKTKMIVNFYEAYVKRGDVNPIDGLVGLFKRAMNSYEKSEPFCEWVELIPQTVIEYEIERTKRVVSSYKTGRIDSFALDDIRRRMDNAYFLKDGFLKKSLVENGFFLVNFNGNINDEIWYHCHFIAEFAAKAGLKNEFLREMENRKRTVYLNHTDSDRCDALSERCIASAER